MTIAGQLSVTASDDPRFAAGDSIGIVIDTGLTITVVQNVEVSAPPPPLAPAPAPTPPADTTPPADPSAPPANPNSTPPATP